MWKINTLKNRTTCDYGADDSCEVDYYIDFSKYINVLKSEVNYSNQIQLSGDDILKGLIYDPSIEINIGDYLDGAYKTFKAKLGDFHKNKIGVLSSYVLPYENRLFRRMNSDGT